MNRPLPKSTKDFFSTCLIAFCILLLVFGEVHSQAVTISAASGGVAGTPQVGGTTNIAVFGVQLSKDAVAANTVTAISFGLSSNPTGKFLNPRLYESTDATFSGVGTETLITTGTFSATDVSFTGAPLTNFDGTTTAADNEFFFVVVDVDPAVTGATAAIQPSLVLAGVTVSTSTVSGGPLNGTSYLFTAPVTTIVNLSTGLAASPLLAGSTGQGVFGFSLTSTGAQTVSVINVQVTSTAVSKWGSYALITSTDNSFATTGDNSAPIGGLTFDASSGTQIAITGLSESITTAGKNYFLVVNVNAAVNAATTAVQPSLVAANITTTTGTVAGTATGTNYSFAPLLTIATLSTGLAPSPLVAGSTGQGVFGFSLTSSGSQTVSVINVQVTSTAVSKWGSYSLITSTDNSFATTGDNSAPIGGLTFDASSGTQIAITGLSQVITTGTNYFLVVNIDPAVTGATTAIQPTLVAGNITTTGGVTGSATGTNYSFGVATATFAQLVTGIAPSPLLAGVANQAVLGFSAASNSTQTFTAITVLVSSTPASKWGSYSLVRSTDASFSTAGDNTLIGSLTFTPSATQIVITGLSETLNSTAKNYFLVVTVDPSVTSSTTAIQPSFSQTNISVNPGSVNGVTVTGTNYAFNTSQLSDIILNGGTTDNIPYISHRGSNVAVTSPSLATFRIRDGAGVNDPDGAGTTLISLEIQLTNHALVKQIALYDGASEVGTEQTVSGATVTFTGLSLATSDGAGGTKDFTVRATFQNLVTDNFPIHVTITDAVALNTGSGFADPEAGDATTTGLPAPANRIEVLASTFAYTITPSSSPKNTNFPLKVIAKDNQNNVDLDFTGQVTLSENGPGAIAAFGGESLTPNLVQGEYEWMQLQIDASGTYTLTVSDGDLNDATFPNFIITSSASNIVPSTDPVLCYGNSSSTEALGTITITETDNGGFSGAAATYTFSLALPSGFVFDQTVTSGLAVSGGNDLSTPSAYSYPGANVVEFSFQLDGLPDNINTITIGGLRARFPHPGTVAPSPTGVLNITRLGGTANIAGVGAGEVLGVISANQPNPGVTFTVSALSGDVAIDPNTTEFNNNSTAVKLVGSVVTGSQLFTGSGVTFSSPDYRFNPNSLSVGTYPITYTHTSAGGCQEVGIKNLVVYVAGITTLNASYCSNDPLSADFVVTQTFINQRFSYLPANTYQVDHYVYYDPNYNFGDFRPITSPSAYPNPIQFDPSLPEYLSIVQYFGGEIPIGFAVCTINQDPNLLTNPNYIPCNGLSNVGTYSTYQWVSVKPSPAVSFTIQDSFGDSKTSFCLGDAAVDLVATPPNSDDINVDYFRIDGSPDIRLSQVGTSPTVWKFTPGPTGVSGPVGPFSVTYSYVDPATLCRGTSLPIPIKVNEVVPNITFPNDVCAGDPVSITNTTTVRPPAASIVSAGWNFGDQVLLPSGAYLSTIPSGSAVNTSGTYQNPSHLYQSNGTFQINTTITTSDGCVYTTPSQPVDINPVPIATFTWEDVCLGSPTLFNATQNLPDVDINSWVWDFAIGPLTTGTGTGKNTSFTYPSAGKDTVRLIVTSNALCRDTVFKPVFIVPTYSATTPSNSYAQDFTVNDGWIAGGVNSSWDLGTPVGLPIVGDASTSPTGRAWDTNLTGDNNPNESSWVLSGCFDFTGTVKPVISLDVWSDNPSGVDGAVLQYNITGNIEDDVPNDPDGPDGDWERIGAVGSGINWYDDQGISNNPGNQTTISAGWTGNYPQWKKAIFKLDPLVGESKVVLRIAFASSQPRGDGFAFDNIFVGERSRTVLLENFTNSSTIAAPENHNEDNYQNFPSTGSSTELIKIQYHTAFPDTDPINSLNQQMNNSRAAFYGITQSLTVRMDGDFKNGNIGSWLEPLYDDRVLTPSPIKLDVTATKVGAEVIINATVENTTSQPLPVAGVHIFTTIVDKSITELSDPGLLGNSGNDEFVFVAKQMLPSAAGVPLQGIAVPAELGPGEIISNEVTWNNPNGDAIVVFVQSIEGNNKNVYQAFFFDNPVLPEPITDIEDPAYAEKINLFPNPANQEVNIELPAVVTRNTPVLMFDTYGRTVYQNSFAPGEQTKKVNTAELAGGVYLIQIITPEGQVARRKVMVTHR